MQTTRERPRAALPLVLAIALVALGCFTVASAHQTSPSRSSLLLGNDAKEASGEEQGPTARSVIGSWLGSALRAAEGHDPSPQDFSKKTRPEDMGCYVGHRWAEPCPLGSRPDYKSWVATVQKVKQQLAQAQAQQQQQAQAQAQQQQQQQQQQAVTVAQNSSSPSTKPQRVSIMRPQWALPEDGRGVGVGGWGRS